MRYITHMFIIMLVLAVSKAHAVEYVYSRMAGNAILVLTADKEKCLFGHAGYLFTMTGQVILSHCWENIEDNKVRVNYSDGTNREYPASIFNTVEKPKPTKTLY